ncbi:hypothetical protein BH23GEM9_BH23GEM9_33250 [soil metagenome]
MVAGLLVILASCQRAAEPGLADIVVDSLFTVDADDAPAAPTFSAQLAMRYDRSAFVLAPSDRPGELLVLDESGRYVRAFGRRGAGPGELSQVEALAFDAGDSLWVFGAGRADLWDPELRFVRSVPLNFTVRAAATSSDRILLAGLSNDVSEMPYRVRGMERDGSLSLLARESAPILRGDPGSEYRLVGAVNDRRFWVASFHDYDLRLLGSAGDTLLRIDTGPTWWRPVSAPGGVEGFMDLSPAILSIGVDCNERLWVAAGIPLPNAAALERAAEGDVGALRETADHVLRVHEGGRLIAERRFVYMPLRFLDGDTGYSIDPDETRGVRITMWRYGVAESDGVTDSRRPQPRC